MKQHRLVLILCAFMMLWLCPQAQARAGGGSSGTSSSGGSHHTTHNSSSGTYTHPAVTIITICAAFGSIEFLSFYTHAYQTTKVRKYFKPALRQLKQSLPYDLNNQVIDLYYTVQNAWKNQDIVLLSKHLDADLCQQWSAKLAWMAFNKQRNVMKMIHIINAYPFALANEHVFFYIRGIMIDYIEDSETQEMISGSKRPQTFTEFWEITLLEDHILLYRIYQTDELSASDFEPYH